MSDCLVDRFFGEAFDANAYRLIQDLLSGDESTGVLLFNTLNLVLDFSAETATVEDELTSDDEQSVDLTSFMNRVRSEAQKHRF